MFNYNRLREVEHYRNTVQKIKKIKTRNAAAKRKNYNYIEKI